MASEKYPFRLETTLPGPGPAPSCRAAPVLRFGLFSYAVLPLYVFRGNLPHESEFVIKSQEERA